jgi:hypothetical protein
LFFLKKRNGILFYTLADLFTVLVVFELTSCNTFYPDAAVPAYLKSSSVVFSDSVYPQQFGDTTSNITNIWAFYNNNPIGVYDVPALFPILAKGKTLVQFSPGIENNGLQGTRVIYPFYADDTATINFQVNQTVSFIPHFTYLLNTKFAFDDNFERNNFNTNYFHSFGVSDTTMINLSRSPEVKYGAACGYICLNTKDSIYQGANERADSLPTTSDVYLEMDYMCNIPFNVGLRGVISAGDTSTNWFEQVNPISNWNKIYIDLTSYIASANAAGATQFEIAYYASLPPGKSVGQIYLDNIKVVHF